LAIHGALYLAVKTEGDLQRRARTFVRQFWGVLLALTAISLPATISAVRTDALANYVNYPVLFVIPLVVLASLAGMIHFCRKQADRKAFASSCVYLSFMLVGAAVALYPRLLPSSSDPARDITVQNALSGQHTLGVGLAWWTLGMVLAIVYFTIVYRMFRGKIRLDGGYGH
jgi:cytochrome d ubiquinol oxidase subunit II